MVERLPNERWEDFRKRRNIIYGRRNADKERRWIEEMDNQRQVLDLKNQCLVRENERLQRLLAQAPTWILQEQNSIKCQRWPFWGSAADPDRDMDRSSAESLWSTLRNGCVSSVGFRALPWRHSRPRYSKWGSCGGPGLRRLWQERREGYHGTVESLQQEAAQLELHFGRKIENITKHNTTRHCRAKAIGEPVR